jgi:hypothetical protein
MIREDLEQIGSIIDQRVKPLQDGQARLEAKIAEFQGQNNKRLGNLEDGQAHIKTAVEAVQAGQDDIRDKMATEAGVMDLGAKINRINRNHERRIEQLEEKTNTSYKN